MTTAYTSSPRRWMRRRSNSGSDAIAPRISWQMAVKRSWMNCIKRIKSQKISG
jgi:hypothetical protein